MWRMKQGGQARPGKYGAQPTTVDGIRFDSTGEAQRYRELKLMEKAGLIRDLQLQTPFPCGWARDPVVIRSAGYPNGRRVTYRADFTYTDCKTGEPVVEDFKGHDTRGSRLIRAFVEWQYGIHIRLS